MLKCLKSAAKTVIVVLNPKGIGSPMGELL
jgi:hypothetical protein